MKKRLAGLSKVTVTSLLAASLIAPNVASAAPYDIWNGTIKVGNLKDAILNDDSALLQDILDNANTYRYELGGKTYLYSEADAIAVANPNLTPTELDNKIATDLADKAENAPEESTDLVVQSVSAINATQVEVKFSQPVDKASAEAKTVNTSDVVKITGLTLNNPTLSEDGKTLTLTATTAIDVKNAAVVVEPVQLKGDTSKLTDRYVSLFTYEDTVTPDIEKVESKSAGDVATSVTVTFAEPIKSLGAVKINGTTVTPTSFNAGDNTATFNNLNLDVTKTHKIQFVGLTDQADNKLVNKTVEFTVTKDTAAPTVSLSQSVDKDNVIVVEFDKPVTVATAQARLINGVVKGETLGSVTSATATPVNQANGLAKKYEIEVTTPFASEDTRNLTVVIPAGIKDALGNEVAATTKKVTLTKDVTVPEISSVEIVRAPDGKVTGLKLKTDSTLDAKIAANAATLAGNLTVVNSEGVLVPTNTGAFELKQNAITAGDKEITLSFQTPAKFTGKYTITFAKGLATDEAVTPNDLKSKTVVVDFGAASTTDTFEIGDGDVDDSTDNVIVVDFGAAVKGGEVAGSATDLANYTLNGVALPEGTTITLNGTKDEATITLPDGSVAVSDTDALFTISNVQRVSGETIKPYTGTVVTVDNVKPVLESAKVLDNKTIELTYSEAIGTLADNTAVITAFEIKNGSTTAMSFSGSQLKASKVSGFDKKVRITIDQGTDAVGTATAGGSNASKVSFTDATLATDDTAAPVAYKIVNNSGTLEVQLSSDSSVVTELDASGDGKFTLNGVEVVITGGADADTFTVATTARTFATVLDLTKGITVETKGAVIKDVEGNTQKAGVKVTVAK